MDPEEEEEVLNDGSSDNNSGGTGIQGSDLIRTLQLLELSVKPAYLLACYATLAESHDWKKESCECLPQEIILNSHSSFRERRSSIVNIVTPRKYLQRLGGRLSPRLRELARSI